MDYIPSHAGAVGSVYSSICCCYPWLVDVIWAAHAGVHQAFRGNALAAGLQITDLHCPHKATPEVVIHVESLQLE